MNGAEHHQLTPTQIQSIERSKAFKAKIAKAAAKLADLQTITMLEALPTIPPIPQSKRQWFQIVDEHAHQPFITDILIAVGKHYGVSHIDICSRRRTAKVAYARQVAYYLCKKLTRKSLPEIGRRIGDRDHTSIWFGVNKIERLRSIHPELDADICTIASSLGGFLG